MGGKSSKFRTVSHIYCNLEIKLIMNKIMSFKDISSDDEREKRLEAIVSRFHGDTNSLKRSKETIKVFNEQKVT